MGLPLRIAAGVPRTRGPGFTLSLDVSLNLPHDVRVAYDLEARNIAGVVEADRRRIEETVLHRTFQPNVNVGVELGIVDTWSSTSAPSRTSPRRRGGRRGRGRRLATGPRAHVRRLGCGRDPLLAVTRLVRAELRGRAVPTRVLEGDLTLESALQTGLACGGRSTLTRWTLAGTIGSNYSFLPDKPAAPPPPPAKPPPP